jgi:hypothetical protein
MSADCEPELEKEFALEEVVKGLVGREPLNRYDAVQITDREQARALINAPREHVSLRETAKGKVNVALEVPRQLTLQLNCDAPDAHPVDGIPEVTADGTSFTTITVRKIDESGELQQGKNDNDLLYLRTDYGTIYSADGKEEINSIKLKKGQAAFRLVSEKVRRVATVQVFNADANLLDRSIRIEFI